MAVYSVSGNTVELAIAPVILCKLCLQDLPVPEMYEMKGCDCLYCYSVSYFLMIFADTNIPKVQQIFFTDI